MGIGHHTLDMYKTKFKGSGFYSAMVQHQRPGSNPRDTVAFASRRWGVRDPQQDKWAGASTLRLAPRGQLNTPPQ